MQGLICYFEIHTDDVQYCIIHIELVCDRRMLDTILCVADSSVVRQ